MRGRGRASAYSAVLFSSVMAAGRSGARSGKAGAPLIEPELVDAMQNVDANTAAPAVAGVPAAWIAAPLWVGKQGRVVLPSQQI